VELPSLSGLGSPGSMLLSTGSALFNQCCVMWCLQAAALPVPVAGAPVGPPRFH
jgi:hypothetical protein